MGKRPKKCARGQVPRMTREVCVCVSVFHFFFGIEVCFILTHFVCIVFFSDIYCIFYLCLLYEVCLILTHFVCIVFFSYTYCIF